MCGFEAFINGKHIIGEVKEKEQAHREYREAISKGHGAYLMEHTMQPPSRVHHDIIVIVVDSDDVIMRSHCNVATT